MHHQHFHYTLAQKKMFVVKIELCKAYLMETPILINKGFEVVCGQVL